MSVFHRAPALMVPFALTVALAPSGPAAAGGPSTPGAVAALPDAAAARAAFDRFRSLAGTWKGKSTKGWEESTGYRVIAGESVVMGTSFDAHPDETMITMIHLDGDRLLLTHYCVARNQPRLVATSVDEAKGEVLFEFLDATGISSRDQGHMDKVIWRFEGPDRFTSQWTWYQAGEESWMEEIVHMRE